MIGLQDVQSDAEFDQITKAHTTVVAHFHAPWCEPCKQLDKVLSVLAQDHKAAFVRVEAEEVTGLSVRYEVAVVPLCLFLKDGKVVSKLEGADVALLTAKVAQYCPITDASTTNGPLNKSTEASIKSVSQSTPQTSAAAVERVKRLISSQPVMLLMKGTPDVPRCGFSSRVVKALQKSGTPFGHFDILSDETVRQTAKVVSDWPSYPQLYVHGELMGGCDIVEELEASGELQEVLHVKSTEAPMNGVSQSTPQTSEAAVERVKELISSQPVMLLMKGTPDAPRCGFSSRVVKALQKSGTPFGHFDILSDETVRQTAKVVSDWPSYPQLYVHGELIGGCDIVEEMEASGELQQVLHVNSM